MNDQIHMGVADSLLRKMKADERQIAQIHFLHDFGLDAAKFVAQHYSSHEIQNGILSQRADMRKAGTLYDGQEHLIGKIDLVKLGVSPEHIEQINSLAEAERQRNSEAGKAASARQQELVDAFLCKGNGNVVWC